MTRIIKKHKFISFCILVAVIACAVTFAAEFSTSEEDIRAKEKAIEETIKERAMQCYIIEDAYPESLSYLEKNYGLAVNKEDYLFDRWIVGKNLRRLKAGQRLSGTGRVPHIGILITKPCPVDQRGSRIHLIRPHDHDGFICLVQNREAVQHPVHMIPRKKCDGEILQLCDPDIVLVRPEEGKTVHQITVGICKILCIDAIGDDKHLNVAIQPNIGMLLIPHDLVDCLAEIHTTAL